MGNFGNGGWMLKMYYALALIPLVHASYTDLKTREIENWTAVFVFLLAILFNPYTACRKITTLLPLILVLLVMVVTGRGLGGGDIKILLALTALLGDSVYLLLLVATVVGLVYALLTRQKTLPFAPCILAGYLAVLSPLFFNAG